MNAPSSLAGLRQLPLTPPPISPKRRQGGLFPLLALRARRGSKRSPIEEKTAVHLALSRPRRMGRSGRAVLIWVLVWYAAAQFGLVLIKDRWQTINSANESIKWPALRRLAASEPDRPLALMLGSSRACWGFRAGALNGMPGPDGQRLRFYNFGIPATGPIHEWLYLREMLDEGIRPRLLLVEVLPPLLGESQRGALSEEHMTGFSWMSGRDFVRMMPYLSRPGRRGRDWLQARIAPWYVFRQKIQGEVEHLLFETPLPPSYPVVDESGWRIMFPFPFPADERALLLQHARDGYATALGHFQLGEKPCRVLHDLLGLCRRERIPVALIEMPESSEFRALYSAEAREATRGLLAQLSRDYDAPLIDANRWLADEDFEDGHHVLAHGAEVFTNRLYEEIQHLMANGWGRPADLEGSPKSGGTP